MNPTKQLLSVSTAVLCAAALAPATGLAESSVERGSYTGKTTQSAPIGGKSFSAPMTISLGILSDPARVTRIELTARLTCADGTTRDTSYRKVIAFGPQLDAKRHFVHRDGGLVLRGKFGRSGKAHGSFSFTLDGCTVAGAAWKASQPG
jgi:hypothetical protein